MQIKLNFNNFIFYGVSVTAWQRRRWRLWLAYPIMTSFRYVPYVSYAPYVSSVTFLTYLTLRALRWMETLLKAGRVHLCRVAGNIVGSHMAGDAP